MINMSLSGINSRLSNIDVCRLSAMEVLVPQ